MRNIWTEELPDGIRSISDGPVHAAFALTYASYLVLPRVLMQQMPIKWQERFCMLIDEYWTEWDSRCADVDYEVQKRDPKGLYVKDPLAEYRHPDHVFIENLRVQESS